MCTSPERLTSQRGAVLIHVAIALLGLVGFTAFVVDYGILWVARGQAQTAADAAVLAAAQSMAFDNSNDTAHFQLVGKSVGQSNAVFGEAPDIQLTDITFPPCPPTLDWGADTCVRAHVYRNQERLNPLPTFFGAAVGIDSHGVRATATARAIAANATNCLKPWAVGDKWLDTQPGGWTQDATFDAAAGDSYTPPTETDPGTGFSQHDENGVPTYYGYQMVLKYANPGQGQGSLPINSAGWAMELALNHEGINNPASTPAYRANITGCTSDIVGVSPPGGNCAGGVNPAIGCIGVITGSTGTNNGRAVAEYIAANDPNATWTNGPGGDWRTGTINSTEPPSRRIVPVAVFDVPEYLDANYHGVGGVVRLVKIVGFFLEGTCETVVNKDPYLVCPGGGSAAHAIVGRLVNYPGLSIPNGGTIAGAFGQVIVLVR